MALCDGSDAQVDSIVLRHDAADAPGIACFEVNKQFCKRKQRNTLSCPRRTRMHNLGPAQPLCCQLSMHSTRLLPFPSPISQPHLPSPFAGPLFLFLHFLCCIALWLGGVLFARSILADCLIACVIFCAPTSAVVDSIVINIIISGKVLAFTLLNIKMSLNPFPLFSQWHN